MDRKDVEPVEQVLSKCPRLDCSAQVAVRRSDDSHVHRNRMAASHPLDRSLLKDSQQRNLRLSREFTDFIQKKRSAICQIETAQPALRGPRERALLVTKQLRGNQ